MWGDDVIKETLGSMGYYTLYRPTQHAPEEEGWGGGSRSGIFIKICINCAILCQFQPFLRRSFILISLMSRPLKIWFCQFTQSASLIVSRSAIAPKMKVRSRAKSDWAISKSDMPSSAMYHTDVISAPIEHSWSDCMGGFSLASTTTFQDRNIVVLARPPPMQSVQLCPLAQIWCPLLLSTFLYGLDFWFFPKFHKRNLAQNFFTCNFQKPNTLYA